MVLANKNPSSHQELRYREGNKENKKLIELDDGNKVIIRPLNGADMRKLVRFYTNLSKETLYYRYFSSASNLISQELKRVKQALQRGALILAAESLDEDQRPIVGISEILQCGTLDSAECAVIVTETWQGKHLGWQMLEWLIYLAKEKGINRIMGYYIASNQKVNSMLQKAGYKYKTDRHLNVTCFTLFLNLPLKTEDGA